MESEPEAIPGLNQAVLELVRKYGYAALLQGLATSTKTEQEIIKHESDGQLGTAFDYLLQVVVAAYPLAGKRTQALMRPTLLSQPVLKSLKIRKADSPCQSPAMREAWAFIVKLQEDVEHVG